MIQLPSIDERSALIVVDAQPGFDQAAWWGPRNNTDCDQNIAALVNEWQRLSRPFVFAQHNSSNPLSPLNPGNPGHALKSYVSGTPNLLVQKKTVNSSFHGIPDLDSWLREKAIATIVICGITTNHCGETPARVGGNLGSPSTLLWMPHTFDRADLDGVTISAAKLSRRSAINLHDEFATVVRSRELLNP